MSLTVSWPYLSTARPAGGRFAPPHRRPGGVGWAGPPGLRRGGVGVRGPRGAAQGARLEGEHLALVGDRDVHERGAAGLRAAVRDAARPAGQPDGRDQVTVARVHRHAVVAAVRDVDPVAVRGDAAV